MLHAAFLAEFFLAGAVFFGLVFVAEITRVVVARVGCEFLGNFSVFLSIGFPQIFGAFNAFGGRRKFLLAEAHIRRHKIRTGCRIRLCGRNIGGVRLFLLGFFLFPKLGVAFGCRKQRGYE